MVLTNFPYLPHLTPSKGLKVSNWAKNKFIQTWQETHQKVSIFNQEFKSINSFGKFSQFTPFDPTQMGKSDIGGKHKFLQTWQETHQTTSIFNQELKSINNFDKFSQFTPFEPAQWVNYFLGLVICISG